MVKNKGKGGKNRRRGKADGDMKRELTFKEDGQGACAGRPFCRETPLRRLLCAVASRALV